MTSILLIIVGIALAAAAALMLFFYGGGAFESGSVQARATTLENAALSVTSAAHLYLVEKAGVPADMRALVTSSYLAEKPALAGIGVQSETWRRIGAKPDGSGGRLAYVVDDIPGEVCLAILHLHHQDDTAIPAAPTTSPTGCFQMDSGTDAVFYAHLPDQDGSLASAAPASPTTPVGSKPPPPDDTPTAPKPTAADQHAASVRQVGATVAAAGRSFIMATGRVPQGDGDLAPDFVTAVPRTPYATAQSWAYYSVGMRALYQLSVSDPDVCRAINAASNGYGYNVIPGGQERGVDEGCYENAGLGLIYVRWYTG